MVHFVELETERSGFRVRVSSLSWLDFRLMAGSIDRLTGTVRWFDVRRGFGFIMPEDGGEDLFVHQSSIKAVGYRSLAVGETVEFVVSVGDGGRRRAVSVTGPGGAYIKGNKYFGGSCYRCGEVGHMVKDCKSIGICARLGPCYSCGEMGHLARECPATRIEPSSPRPNLFKPSKLSSMSNFSLPMAMLSDLVKEDMRTISDGFWESMDSDEEEEDVLSDEDKEFPRRLEERNWAELPRDVLSVIFKKIAAVEIISSVQFVCRPWRQLSHEPELWRRIDMRAHDDYLEKMLDLESMARVAVDRSEGCVEEFYAENFGSDEFMDYIAERATKMRCLHLISVFHMSDMALVEAVRRFPLLEEFEISFCSFADEVVELVGQACPQLKSFRLNAQPYESQYDPDSDLDENVDTVPLAIAKHMQQLRRLQLLGNSLTNIGLLAILDNCPNLQCLDIRRCVNVLLDETLKKKCARIKDLRLPNDSTADCEFDALITGPETFDDDFESTLFGTEYDFQYDDYGYYDYGGFSSMIYDDMIYDDLFLDY